MKSNKILIIIILLLIIIILILSLKTEKSSTENIDNKKIEIPKITIPKIIIPQTTDNNKEKELSKVVSALKSIVEEDESSQQNIPTEDDIQNILSNLKALKPVESDIKPSIKKETHIKKKIVINKKSHTQKKIAIKRKKITKKVKYIPRPKKKVIIYKKPLQKEEPITAEEYRKRLAKESEIDKDISSLPMVETIDINKVKKLTTPKPLVKKKTIYIPSNEKKIVGDIPWAKLHNVEERVDGILIKELIN
ncbi:hypothetical protein MNB_SV-12-1430 [hydrothermal vent metagenome]|uniref:Uncharacterized protein n=1 Tax=hydrothermal vent metagenome TaxID=652676 RepID=A0A1W1CED1_9ZZZZ